VVRFQDVPLGVLKTGILQQLAPAGIKTNVSDTVEQESSEAPSRRSDVKKKNTDTEQESETSRIISMRILQNIEQATRVLPTSPTSNATGISKILSSSITEVKAQNSEIENPKAKRNR
jgi:hypothetical protein